MEKEYKKDYAILFKRELISEEYYIYLFKPCYIVEGFYDEKNQVFLDELNVERLVIDNSKMVNSDEEYYVGFSMTEDELLAKYSKARNVGEAKIYLNDDAKDFAVTGVYDQLNDRVTIMQIDLDDMLSNLSTSMNNDIAMIDTAHEEELDNEEFYENYKKIIGSDFSVLTKEEYDTLMSLEDLDEIIRILQNINTNKKSYGDKIKALSNMNIVLIIPDDVYDKILDFNDVDAIKNSLELIFTQSEEKIIELVDQQFSVSYDDIILSNDTIYKIIMESETVNDAKEYLNELLENYKDSLTEVEESDIKENYPATLSFCKVYISALERIIKYNDLELIKKTYDKLYQETQELASKMALEQSYAAEIESVQEEKKQLEDHEEKQKEYEKLFSEENLPSYRFDYQEVHDKMVARVIGRDSQIDSILTTIERNDKIKNPSKRNAMIIAGTTGTGKTQTFTELKNALADIRPVNVVDTNQITSEGYVGGTIEDNILASLIIQAHSINEKKNNTQSSTITSADIALAAHGIVILDEIDKRAEVGGRGDNVNKSGVVHQLLKLMDPSTKYMVKVGRQAVEFDTSALTIFASGAFQEYFEDIENKSTKPGLGFNATFTETKKAKDFEKYNEVDPNELVKYGLDRQFVGRFNRITLFPTHTKESLLELETNKATSNIQVEIDEYQEQGISLIWEDGFIEKAVDKAYEMKTGGRALANIINRSLGNLNVEVNNRKGMFKAIFIPIKALDDPGNIMLLTHDKNTVLLRDLYEESKKRNQELKIINKIVRDDENYEELKQTYDFFYQQEEQDNNVKQLVR